MSSYSRQNKQHNRQSSRHSQHSSRRSSDNGHGRYPEPVSSSDMYHQARDDYNITESTRGSSMWTPTGGESRHDEWAPRYESDYNSTYPESSSSWMTPAPPQTHFSSRDHPQEWTQESSQGYRPNVHRPMEHNSGWGRDHHSRDKSFPKFQQRDNGWDTRRDNGWATRQQTTPRVSEPSGEDRAWEPAAGWQASQREEFAQNQSSQRNESSSSKKHSKKDKKSSSSSKSKRDWKSDDGSLNNWSRRDTKSSEDKYSKSHPRKADRRDSRSRSPSSYSYDTRHSSPERSRSRSRSPASKRRKRNSSNSPKKHSHRPLKSSPPPLPRGRSPSPAHHARPSWDLAPSRRSASPNSTRGRVAASGRRMSFSSISSRSSERSRSRSPIPPPRAVHRLPTATESFGIAIPTKNGNQHWEGGARNGQNHSNGRGKRNRKNRKQQSLHQQHQQYRDDSAESMPPPPFPTSLPQRPSFAEQEPSLDQQSLQRMSIEAPVISLISPNGPWGTKSTPSRPSAPTLKQFFPGDDEDMDLNSDDPIPVADQVSALAESGVPTPRPQSPASHLERTSDANRWPPTPPSSSQHDVVNSQTIDNIPGPGDSQFSMPATPLEKARESSADGEAHPKDSERNPNSNIRETEKGGSSSRTTRLYSIVAQVGEGTFGKVYKARNILTNAHVALKRIRMESERDGFPVTAMREIKLLQSIRHTNVVQLYEMMVSEGSVYMVFEYMDHDLTGILSQSQFSFTDAHLKSLCAQMLRGLGYLHSKGVIHRDIKGSNILLNNCGELKLADFGLARFYQKRRRADYTNRVITLWYRPPELLFGATVYGPEVDMWSAGCIMLELYTKKPVFQGNDEIHQLDMIYKLIGTPTVEQWPELVDLPWYELVKPREVVSNHFRDLFQKWMSDAALDLAEQLLAYDPSTRISAAQALQAPYFVSEEPEPEMPSGLSTLEGEWHELESKRERAKKRKKD